jgi:tRNA(Ile2) C34 agmatinyltransferase TiaS
MAKTKVKVTMYEQRYGSAVMTEEEYQAMFKERVDEIDSDECSFEEWLNDEFTVYELLGMTENEARALFHKANIVYVEEELKSDWVEVEKEIVIDLSKAQEVKPNCCCPCCGRK